MRNLLRTAGLADRVLLHRADLAVLPYPSEIMDAVFVSFTLELFEPPEILAALRECWRLLRPGGRIVVLAMSNESGGELPVEPFKNVHQVGEPHPSVSGER